MVEGMKNKFQNQNENNQNANDLSLSIVSKVSLKDISNITPSEEDEEFQDQISLNEKKQVNKIILFLLIIYK